MKKKPSYWLTNYCKYWWYHKISKWRKHSECGGMFSTDRYLGKNAKKAWKIFYKFRKKDWILYKIFWKNGERLTQEWRWK